MALQGQADRFPDYVAQGPTALVPAVADHGREAARDVLKEAGETPHGHGYRPRCRP
ncbi:hypothetical protein GCM10010272_53110 [Streptomyces lateritius]|nr:hypothetical protein GCM10010272_53110 [Streptomyces lateritius]